MKNIKYLTLIFILISFILSACQKDDTQTIDPLSNDSFSCDIDGKLLSVKGYFLANFFKVDSLPYFAIQAIDPNTLENIHIFINEASMAKGTYPIDDDGFVFATWLHDQDFYSTDLTEEGNRGSITIDYVDSNHIIGSFYFTVFNDVDNKYIKVIKNGKFDVSYL